MFSLHFYSITKQCAPHLVYISLLFQLFLLGLVISLVLLNNKPTGIALAVLSVALAVNRFLANAEKLESPVIFDVNFSVRYVFNQCSAENVCYIIFVYRNTLHYFELVHFSLSSQVLPYIMGIFAASMIKPMVKTILFLDMFIVNSFSLQTRGNKFDVFMSTVMFIACLFAPLLHNKYQQVPKDRYPHFILGVKIISGIACIFASRCWPKPKEETKESQESKEESKESQESKEESKEETSTEADAPIFIPENIKAVLSQNRVVSFSKAMVKLSLSMFLISMFYIRFDYFSSRLLYSVSAYDAVSNTLSSRAKFVLYLN